MKHIIGKDRSQFEMFCLEESVNKDNEVRLIDLFVESLPLEEYGFIEENRNPLGGKLLAGDGSVFRAQNSKKNNYNQKKIDRQRQAIVEHPFGTIKRQWGI